MGSLHCARICMDVIAALIGRCRHRPASYPGSPRLADSAARSPAPPERSGRAAGAGRGWGGPAGGGGGADCYTPQLAGRGRGPGRWLAGEPPGLNLLLVVLQVVDKRAGKPGAGSSGMGEEILGSHDGSIPLMPSSCTLTRGEQRFPTDRKRRC